MKRFAASIALIFSCILSVGQTAFIQLAKSYADAGDYLEAIRLMKNVALQERDTEFYIDDIATIARYYTHTNELDSALWYNKNLQDLALQLVEVNKSLAEEYYQSSVWNYYNLGEYEQAVSAAEVVLTLRGNIYGIGSEQYFEWLDTMTYKAFKDRDFKGFAKYCHDKISLSEQIYGINSSQYKDNLSSIRAYAHQLVTEAPEFTTSWILPYYTQLARHDILPQYQYEFELLQLDGFLTMENLRMADEYAHKLEKWTYQSKNNIVPVEDKVRIELSLANHYLHMGDHYKSRFNIENAWKILDEAHIKPSLAQLIDRHIVERQLKMDTLGRSRINAEWLIKTATPIIEAGVEDSETIGFFYESRAWAYDELNDYVNAISDIQNAIRLKPLYSRKKKLGQFYLENKDYDLAENVFLELYYDPAIPDVGKKSIESDLTVLYWLWGKLDNLTNFIIADYDNMKSEIKNAFAFMGEDEREHYLSHSLLGGVIKYDFYTAYSDTENQWAIGNAYAYNMALVQKGLLLNTSREIRTILKEVPDSLKETLHLYELATANTHPYLAEISGRDYRKKLMGYVSAHPNYLSQLYLSWQDVRDRLKDNEAAIEFINLWGVTPATLGISVDQWDTLQNLPKPCKGALILRHNYDYPVFVKLSDDSLIEDMSRDEDGNEIIDVFYLTENISNIYNAFWAPIEKYLSGVNTIYYAPTGDLQKINFDWIGEGETDQLCNRYDMYRVSSTREIINRNINDNSDNAVLYGDIAYSAMDNQVNDTPLSKYRSITRSGFAPLYGTANELDSIALQLTDHSISSSEFTKNLATEKSFRDLSGKSPEILHIATHGFYFSKEALEEELPKGNFMAFQFHNPELYHSGLALAGAQDTWINDYEGDGINFEKYFEMDASSDGILLSSEIAELDLKGTDLVVLSACETALGKITSDGVYGLQRAFKLAGVNSIIMSLWKVDDDATQILMNAFYTNYLNGMSKIESLRKAQQTVKETPGYDKPYYWASFILLDGLN